MIDDPQDPRTREFLARTHGTGAHVHERRSRVHAGAAIDAPVVVPADLAGPRSRGRGDTPHGH